MRRIFLKLLSTFFLVLLIFVTLQNVVAIQNVQVQNKHVISTFSPVSADVIAISDSNPFYSLLGSPAACYYQEDESILKPFLIYHNGSFSVEQQQFLEEYTTSDSLHILTIGDTLYTEYPTISFAGSSLPQGGFGPPISIKL